MDGVIFFLVVILYNIHVFYKEKLRHKHCRLPVSKRQCLCVGVCVCSSIRVVCQQVKQSSGLASVPEAT